MPLIIEPGHTYTYPLNHARIGWINHVLDATITATSEESDTYAADALNNTHTYDIFRPAALPCEIVIDFGCTKTIGYCGIASHTLGSSQSSITLSYWSGSEYIDVDVDTAPGSDAPLMLLFDEIEASQWKITITGSTVPSVGIVYLGKVTEMYRPFYAGHRPARLNRVTDIKNNISITGELLGRTIMRQGTKTSYNWKHIPIDWYEVNIEPLSIYARKHPVFIAWNPATEPQDVVFGKITDDMSPTLMGIRDLSEFGFTLEGFES